MRPHWVKIWTKILDHPAVRDLGAPALAVIVWLVVKAAETEPAGAPVRVSASALGEALGLSRQTIRTVLARLVSDQVIEMAGERGRGKLATVKLLHFQKLQSRHNTNAGNELVEFPRSNQLANHFTEVITPNNGNELRSEKNDCQPTCQPFSEGARARTEVQNLKKFPSPFRARVRAREQDGKEREREFFKKYPEDPAEVIMEAKTRGYDITGAEAESFIGMNASRGWTFDGEPVKTWPRLLVAFLRSLGRKTQREKAEEAKEERERKREERRRREAAEAERLKGETLIPTKTAAEILKDWDKS